MENEELDDCTIHLANKRIIKKALRLHDRWEKKSRFKYFYRFATYLRSKYPMHPVFDCNAIYITLSSDGGVAVHGTNEAIEEVCIEEEDD